MNLARAKSKAIENRAAADGQTAIIRAWGGASIPGEHNVLSNSALRASAAQL